MGADPARPEPTAVEGETSVGRAAGALRVVLGLATITMLGLSWPLWIDSDAFPRVPVVAPGPGDLRPPVSWLLFALLLGSIASTTAGIARRRSTWLSLALLAFLVFRDQQRFQAWAYQFAALACFLAALPDARALALSRGWYVATYAYSALSKLDVSFCRELGGRFLEAASRPMGLEPWAWPPRVRDAAILLMPAWELAVALGLASPATRRLGRWGAVVLHGALLLILGPWGMGHSTIVLVWNAAMLAEVWIAFDPRLVPSEAPGRGARIDGPGWLAWGVFVAGVVWPLGERRGYCDAWPGHALYASHVERTDIYLHEDSLPSYPPEVRRHVAGAGPGPWRRLDLTGWSRSVRGVPAYPQARTCLGVAEALAAVDGDRPLIRVVHWGVADRWTGRRTQDAWLGLEETRRRGDRYWFNAHPAGRFGRGDRGAGRSMTEKE